MIEALLGKRIAHVAPGLSNMVIVTEDHQMIAWGGNDYGQFGKSYILNHNEPEIKMSRSKKLVKSNKSISRKKILAKFHFLLFQKWPKINF